MPIILTQHLLIPFGTANLPDRGIAVSSSVPDGMSVECQIPHVVVNTSGSEPLRLNTCPYHFPELPPFRDLIETEDQLAYVRNYLSAYCDLWGKYQKLFLERYFEFVADCVESNQAELAGRVEKFGILYDYKDWVFSAFTPLPQAHLWAPAENDGAPYDRSTMIPVDFAFWSGKTIFIIDLVGTETRGRKHRELRDRLARAGMAVVEIPQVSLHAEGGAALKGLLPDVFGRFWEGEILPSGPFKPNTLVPPNSEGS